MLYSSAGGNRINRAQKPRIVIVGPVPPSVGGVETVTRAVLESRIGERFEVRHCDITKNRPKETAGRWDWGNAKWAIIHLGRMIASCRDFRPQLVYLPLTGTWTGFARDSALAMIGKWYGATVIGHVHGAWFYRVLAAKGAMGYLVRRCLARFDALLVLGSWWKKIVDEYGYAGEVFIVPPTLDRQLYDVAKEHRPRYEQEPVGLFVGSVGKRKGVFDLLDALYELKVKNNKAVRMIIVGGQEEPGEWGALQHRCASLGLNDTVEFTGSLTGEQLYDKYKRAGFFVLPSYAEGLPVSILEAGCFGLPVITTPVGAIRDLILDDENGLLIEPGNFGAIADVIGRLHASVSDRQRLGAALRSRIVNYHPDTVCQRIEECLVTMLNDDNDMVVGRPAVRR